MVAREVILPLAVAIVALSATFAALWQVQRWTRNAGIVDVAWAAAVGATAVFYAAWPAGIGWLRALAGGMLALWSLRLATYLFVRVVGHPEEGRYRTLRESWGADHDRRMFWFYQLQAVAAWAFAGNALAIARSPSPPAAGLVSTAIALWLVGVGGVALADRQLAAFKRDPANRGKTCRAGLWRTSRHPNYFFEWLHWCSYIPLAANSPGWWVPVVVAAGLLYLLLFVTGIPPTERQALASRGDEYRAYQRSTSAFVPWFPRTTHVD